MVKTILKRTLLAMLALLVLAVTVLTFQSRSSLDRDFTHARTTAALPVYPGSGRDELIRINANGWEFRARIAGFDDAADKPTIVLLHGFPVTSAMWVPAIKPLVNAGFRVVAPDQRGYSPGARPEGAEHYSTDKLALDVLAIADELGLDQFHLVGHDWGAVVGWTVVLTAPSRVLSWTGLSIAHPVAFGEALENDPVQRQRSSYFLFFATPWLPETLLSRKDFRMMKGFYGPMSPAQVDEYLAVFSEPGALTAALNWYRAMMGGTVDNDTLPADVDTPTLFIWGNQDQAVSSYGVEAQRKYMKGPYQEVELDVGHWLMEEQADTVTAAMLAHISRYRATR